MFHLLETIFDSFDVVARRRGIFKVETVGDCYVAASGLPEFQPDHAYQVSCFAVEIMAVFELAKFTLAGILGEDVYGLRLRVGLNSGGITAGVLRGEVRHRWTRANLTAICFLTHIPNPPTYPPTPERAPSAFRRHD